MPANIFREVFPDIFLKNRHFSGFVVLPRLLGNCRVYRNGVAGIHRRYISCCGAICLLLPFFSQNWAVFAEEVTLGKTKFSEYVVQKWKRDGECMINDKSADIIHTRQTVCDLQRKFPQYQFNQKRVWQK